MSTLLLQLYSQNHWLADGSQTIWNFTFADGYLSRDFIKAYMLDELDTKTEIPVDDSMFTGEFQLEITPAVPENYKLVILRDTPKDAPLVNFQDGARVSEVSLDTIARQAVHVAAEVLDGSGQTLLTAEFGFKNMKREVYEGVSVVQDRDAGRCHYKTDATGVTVPNTLPAEFLTTIINNNDASMPVTFDDGGAILQGSDDTTEYDSWVLAPRNSLSIWKAEDGQWLISGKAEAA